MPHSSGRLCSHPGCRQFGFHNHRTDDRRQSAAKRGYDRHHQRWRMMVLNRCPYCRLCEAEGRVTLATDADHIIPLARGGGWGFENSQGLCHRHHSIKTAREDGGFGRPRK